MNESPLIPQSCLKRPKFGEVYAVGPGRWTKKDKFIKNKIKIGWIVLFAEYYGIDIHIDGKHFIILREDEIFARITDYKKYLVSAA